MFIKKNRRKPSDGPSHSGGLGQTEGQRWTPTPYDGRSPNGRRTWVPGNWIRIEIGSDEYAVDGVPLAVFLSGLGITDGDPDDWVQDSRVAEWVRSHGVRKDRSLNP